MKNLQKEKLDIKAATDGNNNIDGNVADDESEHEKDQSFSVPLEKETSSKPVCVQIEPKMPLPHEANEVHQVKIKQEEENTAGDHMEIEKEEVMSNNNICKGKVAPRKGFGITKTLRRPRIPAALTNVPGTYVYGDSSPKIKTEKEDGIVMDTTNCIKIKSEKEPVKEYAEQSTELAVSQHDNDKNGSVKECPKEQLSQVKEEFSPEHEITSRLGEINIECTRKDCRQEIFNGNLSNYDDVICFGSSPLCHRKIKGVCTDQENDCQEAKYDEKFNYILSKLPEVDEKHTAGEQEEIMHANVCQIEEEREKNSSCNKFKLLKAVMIKKSYGPPNDSLFRPIGVAELPDGNVVVADTFNDRIALFSQEGKFIDYFYSSCLRRPSAVVSLQDGKFAVKDNRSIVIFSTSGLVVKTLASNLKRPYGLTIDNERNLLTVETTENGYLTLVTLNPDSGQVVKRTIVDLALPYDCLHISKPRFISNHKDGQVLVVDLGLNCVYIIDIRTGTLISLFGEAGSNEGQFLDPSGITCDCDGNILVGDSRNHRVQIFDPKGNFICILGLDTTLDRPSGICLTSHGHLLILNYWENSLARFCISG